MSAPVCICVYLDIALAMDYLALSGKGGRLVTRSFKIFGDLDIGLLGSGNFLGVQFHPDSKVLE